MILKFIKARPVAQKSLTNRGKWQHLSAVKNRKLCSAALAQKGKLCGRVRRKLSNYAEKLRRIFTKSAVIVWHFQLIFGSNWLKLCINDVVGGPDQTTY